MTQVDVLANHYGQLRGALSAVAKSRSRGPGFEPAFDLPDPTPALAEYFSVARLRFAELGQTGRVRLRLLDLMGNPATRTVKTFASLIIVARAVRHIQRTGEPVMILTPSSANKATALRDAVLRAYRTGLVNPSQLQIVTVVPGLARPKLWASDLCRYAELAVRNPMCVLDRMEPEQVKTLAGQAAACADELFAATGVRLWHTLDLANYQCADAVRAFAEHAVAPPARGTTRAHAHAVSSAFGLLGHHFGTGLLPERTPPPQYFLVQHLSTSDMVRSLHDISPPPYQLDPATGLYEQDVNPRYPRTTFHPTENLEPTFYTRSPATSPAMNAIIRAQGGGGIVVSRHECLARYEQIHAMLSLAGVTIPERPTDLREWSLVMVLTGVLNAIERGLVDADEVLVHGSGSYGVADMMPMPEEALHRVFGPADLRRVVLTAASRTPAPVWAAS